MAYSILLVFEKPDVKSSLDNADWWHMLSNRLRSVASKDKEIELLGENVLLIPLNKRLEVFSEIFPNPDQRKPYPYKYLILSEDIEWHGLPKKS
jgi:hypothetical protein